MTEQDKLRIVGNLIELLELRRKEHTKLHNELGAKIEECRTQANHIAYVQRRLFVVKGERDLAKDHSNKLVKERDTLAKYADSRDALAERLRKELDAHKAATERLQVDVQQYAMAWHEAEAECAKLRKELAAEQAACGIRDTEIGKLRKERDHEARVAEQRGKALDLALSDLNRALGRARKLEAAIREHKAAKLGSQIFPLPSDIGLWEVLDKLRGDEDDG